jgi:hypothetical protein
MDYVDHVMPDTSDFDTAKAATEKVVAERDCPWCVAKAGELCYSQKRNGFGEFVRSIFDTHTGRFPAGVTPEEYLAG